MQAFLATPRPPNFTMSLHAVHFPHSLDLHPSHLRQRIFRFLILIFDTLVTGTMLLVGLLVVVCIQP